jgi:RNA-binding protein YhbY
LLQTQALDKKSLLSEIMKSSGKIAIFVEGKMEILFRTSFTNIVISIKPIIPECNIFNSLYDE